MMENGQKFVAFNIRTIGYPYVFTNNIVCQNNLMTMNIRTYKREQIEEGII